MTDFPDVIKIRVIDFITRQPVPRIAIRIQLFAQLKNDYFFILPISDESGNIKITKDWLRKEIQIASELFIMDYASSLETCYPKFKLEIIDRYSVELAVKGMKSYKEYTHRSQDHIAADRKSVVWERV